MRIFLTILFVISARILPAQFTQTCIEPARVQPSYQCNMSFYDPVCGCDNITYRNQCNAYFNHGVNVWRTGVCNGIDVDIYPNPVVTGTPFTVNLSYDEFIYANADVKIVDMYGKIWEHRMVNNFNRMMIQFDISVLATGVYILVVQSSLQTGVVKVFSKY